MSTNDAVHQDRATISCGGNWGLLGFAGFDWERRLSRLVKTPRVCSIFSILALYIAWFASITDRESEEGSSLVGDQHRSAGVRVSCCQ